MKMHALFYSKRLLKSWAWFCAILCLTYQITAETAAPDADALDTWTAASSGTLPGLKAVTFGNGRYVAVGYNGAIISSPDGNTWTKRGNGNTNQFFNGIVYAAGKFVAVGGFAATNGPVAVVFTSMDGIKWTEAESGIASVRGLLAITYGNGYFIAVGNYAFADGSIILSSLDGEHWTPSWKRQQEWTDPIFFSGVAYGNNRFVAVYPGGSEQPVTRPSVCTSSDGLNWEKHDGAFGLGSIAYCNGQFIGVGGDQSIDGKLILRNAVIYTSPDGLTWTKRLDVSGNYYNRFYNVASGGGQYVAVGHFSVYSSSDSIKWVERKALPGAAGIVYNNGQFIAVGGAGAVAISGVIGKLGASLSPNGDFMGTITGVTGQKYAIESSAGLQDWTALTNVTIANGLARFDFPQSTGTDRRFFKAMAIRQ